MKKYVYVMVGPSGSGKTTYVKEHSGMNDIIVSSDEMKKEMYGIVDAKISNDFLFWNEFHRRILDGMNGVNDVWVDSTNLYKKDRMMIKRNAIEKGYKMVCVNFKKPLNELLLTDAIDHQIIINQFYSQEDPEEGIDTDKVILMR